ncbi:MAG: hypothetical protein PSX36_14920 [bacterium]|nr:hypothetical protein [bacterium]
MRFVTLLLFSFSFLLFKAGATDDSLARKRDTLAVFQPVNGAQYCKCVIGILNPVNNCNENYVFDRSLYDYKVDTLPQVRFWRNIMNLHQDSAIICFADSREEIEKICITNWNCKSELEKKTYRDSIRCGRNLDSTSRILLTTGKKFFYDFDRTSQNFHRGINCFVANNVDPWYAQAILLIESPNKLQKSHVGAYGPFQLMKDVARMYGLKVNKYVDERADFDRSAFAASSLIKSICIPQAHKMLDSMNIKGFSDEELWFRLFVMHVYHAGAYNVQKALYAIHPTAGDMDLIYTLWRTQTARFKSASQNYSQLVLAAMLEMNERNHALARISPSGN